MKLILTEEQYKLLLKEDESPFDESELNNLEKLLRSGNIHNLDIVFAMLEDYPSTLDKLIEDSPLDILLKAKGLNRTKEDVNEFMNSKHIAIDGKELNELPEFLFNLPRIRTLTITNCNIQSLPSNINNSNLKELDLRKNNITVLPESIGNLTSLAYLDLSDNEIEILPESIGNLTKLGHLDLGDNKIKILPESFRNLVDLEWLMLNDNELIGLDSTPFNFKKLEYVWIGNNRDLFKRTLKNSVWDKEDVENVFYPAEVFFTNVMV
jgi:Leucine-rich repeat (LRR) protein